MVDKVDINLHIDQGAGEKKVDLISSFSCPGCDSGAEKYSELFHHGTCVNCGTPLKEFEATLTEKGEGEIKGSFLLLYSEKDMAKTAEDVMSELKKNGIGVIDAHDIIDGSQTSVVSANLAYVMDKTAGVLVIPSEHLEDNSVMETCLNNAIVQKVEKSKNIIPVYTTKNISGKTPFGLIGVVGINWDGEVDDRRAIVNKTRAMDHLHGMVNENTSK